MFEIGARVRTRSQRPDGHTRLPRYLERRGGRIISMIGDFRFADDGARIGAKAPLQRLYTVEFEGPEHSTCADLFESYLEPEA